MCRSRRSTRSVRPALGIVLATQFGMPGPLSRARVQRPVEYRDRHGRLWHASQVAQLKIVSPSIDGPNRFLVIRFESEGEKRFVRWLGGDDWRGKQMLHRLFAESEE